MLERGERNETLRTDDTGLTDAGEIHWPKLAVIVSLMVCCFIAAAAFFWPFRANPTQAPQMMLVALFAFAVLESICLVALKSTGLILERDLPTSAIKWLLSVTVGAIAALVAAFFHLQATLPK